MSNKKQYNSKDSSILMNETLKKLNKKIDRIELAKETLKLNPDLKNYFNKLKSVNNTYDGECHKQLAAQWYSQVQNQIKKGSIRNIIMDKTTSPITFEYKEGKSKIITEISHFQVLQGFPGSGKSTLARKKIKGSTVFSYLVNKNTDSIDLIGSMNIEYKELNETMIQQLVYKPNVILQAYVNAYKNPKEKTVIVLDEINRSYDGLANLFGEYFDALTLRKKGVSVNPVKNKAEIKLFLKQNGIENPDYFTAPNNLYIIGTQNLRDKGISKANGQELRRCKYLDIYTNYENEIFKEVYISETDYKWLDILKEINMLIQNEFKGAVEGLGEYYFGDKKNNLNFNDEENLEYDVFLEQVMTTLLFDNIFWSKRESVFVTCDKQKLTKMPINKWFKDSYNPFLRLKD